MHIAVSAEARNRADREFRAIVLRTPSFAPSPAYRHPLHSFPPLSAPPNTILPRLDFNFALILVNIFRRLSPISPYSTPLCTPCSLFSSAPSQTTITRPTIVLAFHPACIAILIIRDEIEDRSISASAFNFN